MPPVWLRYDLVPRIGSDHLTQRHRRPHDRLIILGSGRRLGRGRRRGQRCHQRSRWRRRVRSRSRHMGRPLPERRRSGCTLRRRSCSRPRSLDRGLRLCGLGLCRPGDVSRHGLLAGLEFGDSGLELLDLLRHGRKIAGHRLQLGRIRDGSGDGRRGVVLRRNRSRRMRRRSLLCRDWLGGRRIHRRVGRSVFRRR
jgi:hypothetical protein